MSPPLPSDLQQALKVADDLLELTIRVRNASDRLLSLDFSKVVTAANQLAPALDAGRQVLAGLIPELEKSTDGVVTCGVESATTAVAALLAIVQDTVDLLKYARIRSGVSEGAGLTVEDHDQIHTVMRAAIQPTLVEWKRLQAEIRRLGKTTLLEGLIRSDVERGHGVCLIDPHGDLADKILAAIPTDRRNDVILFDPCDPEYAVAFNPLASAPGFEDRVTSGVVSAFKKMYDSWGPRLEDTLRNATYLAVENGGTLLSILQILTNDAERERFLRRNTNDLALRFWRDEFANWPGPYRTEAVAAILNKIRPFLMNRNVRSVLSQSDHGIDLRTAMDTGKILIANLSKGRLGEDNSNLLGALLVTTIQQAAVSRAEIPEDQRRDFYLYIDEFQNFTTGAFAHILSEARKYRLNMTGEEKVSGTVMGIWRVSLAFRDRGALIPGRVVEPFS